MLQWNLDRFISATTVTLLLFNTIIEKYSLYLDITNQFPLALRQIQVPLYIVFHLKIP